MKYDNIYDPDRLWSYTSPTVKKCDASLYGNFRFGSRYTPWSIKEGCNKMDSEIVLHRCGSDFHGYMEGKHPTVNEGYVERVICFQDSQYPCECRYTTKVGVQNCSSFYVYHITGTPACNARICMVANNSAGKCFNFHGEENIKQIKQNIEKVMYSFYCLLFVKRNGD